MESVAEMASWNAQYRTRKGVRWWPNEELVRYIGGAFIDVDQADRSHLEILDVGCGTGANARFLIEEGFSVIAIDASSEAIKLANTFIPQVPVSDRMPLAGRRQEIGIQEVSILNLPDNWTNRFDGIVDVQTIQHTTYTQHLSIYQNLYCALKPGGFFFSVHMHEGHWDMRHGGGKIIDDFTVDNMSGPDALFPDNGITCLLPGHVMRNVLERSGFVVESIEHLIRTYKQRTREARYLITVAVKE
jgi:SAM-dependent methyltransferase